MGDNDSRACARVLANMVNQPANIPIVAATLSIAADAELVSGIQLNYVNNLWYKKLLDAEFLPHGVQYTGGLLYAGNWLIIPQVSNVCELLFHLAHDVLGHFRFAKTYGSLCDSFYWPNMHQDLEQAYIPGCTECQRNKGSTQKPIGLLHPLPIPDNWGDSMAMDFIGPLPEDGGFNCIITFMDHLNSDIWVIPTCTDISAEDLVLLFFDEWYCKNGLPLEIVSNCNKLFVSKFWQALHSLKASNSKCPPLTTPNWMVQARDPTR